MSATGNRWSSYRELRGPRKPFLAIFKQLGIPSRPFSLPTRVPDDGDKDATDSWPVNYPGGSRRQWENHPDSPPRGGADSAGYRVLQTREPGGTATAEAIRHILLTTSSHEPVTPQAEALLILAARCQHVTHLIMPALRPRHRGVMRPVFRFHICLSRIRARP